MDETNEHVELIELAHILNHMEDESERLTRNISLLKHQLSMRDTTIIKEKATIKELRKEITRLTNKLGEIDG